MTLLILGHSFLYEMENLVRLFFPGEKVDVHADGDVSACDTIAAQLQLDIKGIYDLSVHIHHGDYAAQRTCRLPAGTSEQDTELAMGQLLYELLREYTGVTPPWGILTGVRPVRLLREIEKTAGAEALQTMKSRYLVSDEKLALAKQILEVQRPVIAGAGAKDYSLYVSIPFCPSRCSYCSFVSHDIEGVKKLLPDYLTKLHQELIHTDSIATHLGLSLRTIYIGGGTPTVLEPAELEALMTVIANTFDLSHLLEYTVEAGRPDSVTREKLAVLKKLGATRVSINPQTMDDTVLERIGRKHTAAETVAAFHLAREAGFDRINMDLIAGLPGDNLAGFRRTVEEVAALAPENITVHTLTVKRSSRLREEGGGFDAEAAAMVDYAANSLNARGYLPYYLYRQKSTVQNLENTGYALPGAEGLYNVLIMEEVQTILAVGAGAVTKIVEPSGTIRRIPNYKFP
jgi:oxygen-independent coproporphyrinogen-3 oxidase